MPQITTNRKQQPCDPSYAPPFERYYQVRAGRSGRKIPAQPHRHAHAADHEAHARDFPPVKLAAKAYKKHAEAEEAAARKEQVKATYDLYRLREGPKPLLHHGGFISWQAWIDPLSSTKDPRGRGSS